MFICLQMGWLHGLSWRPSKLEMDPVGPWSAYASYNRLAGVQTSAAAAGELHSAAAAAAAAPPTTTAQLLPGGFLSSPSVAYETVLPFFHHASAKPPAHYVAQVSQHRQVSCFSNMHWAKNKSRLDVYDVC